MITSLSGVQPQIMDADSADTHICGTCKKKFTDINYFITHKQECHVSGGIINDAVTANNKSFAASCINDGTICTSKTFTPLFRVFVETAQSSHLPSHEKNAIKTKQLQAEDVQQSVILRSRLVGPDNHEVIVNDLSLPAVCASQNNQPSQSHKELQMNDEDVAAILANQLANEVITIHPSGKIGSAKIDKLSSSLPLTRKMLPSVSDSTETEGVFSTCNPKSPSEIPVAHSEIILGEVGGSADAKLSTVNDPNDEESCALTKRTRPEKSFSCDIEGCKFTSSYQKDLIRHTRTHTGEKPFTCTVCQKSFSRRDKLQSHQRVHNGVKPHQCELCSYSTAEKHSLVKHLRIHTDERPFKCQICSYRSRDSSQLAVHLRTHTGDNPFVCPYESCSSKFKTASDLKRHIRSHTGEKPYSCSVCDFRCTIKSNLKVHIKLNHTITKSVHCPSCDHIATSNRSAKEHSKLHAEQVLKCGLCEFSCVNRTSMGKHMKIHTQPKPINCSQCLYSCRQLTNLKRHLRTKHPELLSKNDLRKDWASTRMNPASLKRFGYNTHECTYCDASFVREDSWRSHIRQHKTNGTATVPLARSIEKTTLPKAILQESEPASLEPNKEVTSQHTELPTARVDDEEGLRQAPLQEQILRGSSLQSQPMYHVFLHQDGIGEMAPIMFSAESDQCVSVASSESTMVQQLAVSLQSGMQYILSGPIDRVQEITNHVQSSIQDCNSNQVHISSESNEIPFQVERTIITKANTSVPIMHFGNQTL